jgi:phosphoribosylformimino-5-aminoimidazole carboxamide ribotide isomerase
MSFKMIPAIDLLNGKVVRLTQGDYAQVSHYDIDPAGLARQYSAAGASRIHVVDLDGAKAGKPVNLAAIQAIRDAVTCEIEVGGGIRDEASLQQLFEIGIDYAILGSILVKNPEFAYAQCQRFPGKILAGLDCHGDKVAIHGWCESSEHSLFDVMNALKPYPVGGIIYTDIAKDGTLSGPNIDMLALLGQKSPFPIIASGGIGNIAHVREVRQLAGVTGCIIGKAILSGDVDLAAAIALEKGVFS